MPQCRQTAAYAAIVRRFPKRRIATRLLDA
jgi:hypothetical protein